MNNRRKFLKLVGLGAATTATTLVAKTIGTDQSVSIEVNGVKAIDVKETKLYKNHIKLIIEVINEIPNYIYDEKEKYEELAYFSIENLEKGDLSDNKFNLCMEGFEEIDNEAYKGNISGLEDFKRLWVDAYSSEVSVNLLMEDFEDEIPKNFSNFFTYSEGYTESYQSIDG